MDFVWKLYGNTYAVHVTVALVVVATLNLALPAPPVEKDLALRGKGPKQDAQWHSCSGCPSRWITSNHICWYGRWNDFQRGGGKILEVKNGANALIKTGANVWGGMCPPQKLELFENVVLNEVIWCTIFHHDNHLTALLLGCLSLQNRTVKKVRGHAPPSLKSRGAMPPCFHRPCRLNLIAQWK